MVDHGMDVMVPHGPRMPLGWRARGMVLRAVDSSPAGDARPPPPRSCAAGGGLRTRRIFRVSPGRDCGSSHSSGGARMTTCRCHCCRCGAGSSVVVSGLRCGDSSGDWEPERNARGPAKPAGSNRRDAGSSLETGSGSAPQSAAGGTPGGGAVAARSHGNRCNRPGGCRTSSCRTISDRGGCRCGCAG